MKKRHYTEDECCVYEVREPRRLQPFDACDWCLILSGKNVCRQKKEKNKGRWKQQRQQPQLWEGLSHRCLSGVGPGFLVKPAGVICARRESSASLSLHGDVSLCVCLFTVCVLSKDTICYHLALCQTPPPPPAPINPRPCAHVNKALSY